MVASIGVIILIFVLIIFWAVAQWPVYYTIDTTRDTYGIIADDQGWDDKDTVGNTLIYIGWLFVGCIIVPIILVFVYLFALAHKREYDRG